MLVESEFTCAVGASTVSGGTSTGKSKRGGSQTHRLKRRRPDHLDALSDRDDVMEKSFRKAPGEECRVGEEKADET